MREILLVGNPNVGKSTLINSLTNSTAHTGNFHGVTTDAYSVSAKLNGDEITITDLPGIYSLSGFGNEEKLTRDKILNSKKDIVVLADIMSIRRCMYLCIQLDELGIDYILLINTKGQKNAQIDTTKISNKLGHKVYLIDAKKEKLDSKYFLENKTNKSPDYLNKYLKSLCCFVISKQDFLY